MCWEAPWECKSEQPASLRSITSFPQVSQSPAVSQYQQVSDKTGYWTYCAPSLQPLWGSQFVTCRVLWWKEERNSRAPRLTRFAVLFKMLNQSFTWRGGSRGWIIVGRCLQKYTHSYIHGAGRQHHLAGLVASAATRVVNIIFRHRHAGSCRVA